MSQNVHDFQIANIDSLEYQSNKIHWEDIDSPKEYSSFTFNILISSILILISIPFTITCTLQYYENIIISDPLLYTYEWWWIGIVFLIGSIIISFITMYIKREQLWLIFVRITTSLGIFLIFSIFLNSLWIHGTWLYIPYLTSYKFFFTSEIVNSLVLGLISVSILGYIPIHIVTSKLIKHTNYNCTKLDDNRYLCILSEKDLNKITIIDQNV